MPTTYDSVSGTPSYEIPGADAPDEQTKQDERLEAILTKVEALVKEVQADLATLKEQTTAALETLKASVEAHFEALTKVD